MFTLGNKEAIINSSEKFPVTVTAPTGTSSLLTIEGFGAFEDTHIVSVIAQRYIAGRNAGLMITSPDAGALGITAGEVNVPVVVHIRVNTSRYTSEWATDFIKRGRPFIFEVLVDGGDTPASIMTKLVNMFTEYESRFNMSDRGLPFNWVKTGADVVLSLKDPYLSFHNFVDFLPRGLTYGVPAATTKLLDTGITVTPAVVGSTTVTMTSTAGMVVGDTIFADSNTMVITDIINATSLTVSVAVTITDTSVLTIESNEIEPTFDGKYLEENVRTSTYSTSDSYGISTNEKPKISGGYTAITFTAEMNADGGISNVYKPHKFLGSTRGELGGIRSFTFSMYLLEGGTLFNVGNKVDDIMTFLLLSAPATTTMFIANGNSVTTVADFLSNTY